jgi:hypothetical protein
LKLGFGQLGRYGKVSEQALESLPWQLHELWLGRTGRSSTGHAVHPKAVTGRFAKGTFAARRAYSLTPKSLAHPQRANGVHLDLWSPLVSAAHGRGPRGLVLADAECDRERNHQHVRQGLYAQSVIPAQRGGAAWQMHGVRAQTRQECPAALDRRRALIESLTSAVKRQLSARAPGRALATQCLQALPRGVASNV